MSDRNNWNQQVQDDKKKKEEARRIALENAAKESGLGSVNEMLDVFIDESMNPLAGGSKQKTKKRTQADRVSFAREARKQALMIFKAGWISQGMYEVYLFLVDFSVSTQTDSLRFSKSGIGKLIDYDRTTVSKSLKALQQGGMIYGGDTRGRKGRPQEYRLTALNEWLKKGRP